LGFSSNRESATHKRIDDLGKRGFLIVKDHRRLIERRLNIPQQLIRENSFLRFKDKPYPVARIPSPADKRNVHVEEHAPVDGLGGRYGPGLEEKERAYDKAYDQTSMSHGKPP
jgi:hypothetical protein